MDRREMTRNFIRKNMVPQKRSLDFGDDEDIFKSGFVDSMMALKLVTFIEKTFDIVVEDEELDVSTFSTVDRIENFIAFKRGEGSA